MVQSGEQFDPTQAPYHGCPKCGGAVRFTAAEEGRLMAECTNGGCDVKLSVPERRQNPRN